MYAYRNGLNVNAISMYLYICVCMFACMHAYNVYVCMNGTSADSEYKLVVHSFSDERKPNM